MSWSHEAASSWYISGWGRAGTVRSCAWWRHRSRRCRRNGSWACGSTEHGCIGSTSQAGGSNDRLISRQPLIPSIGRDLLQHSGTLERSLVALLPRDEVVLLRFG